MDFFVSMNSLAVDTTDSVPTFSVGGSRYDLTTYGGRLRHFVSIIDPRLLLVDGETLSRSQSLIDSFGKGQLATMSDALNGELWHAKRIIDSAVNRATGEIIHPLARMCAFVPASLPITLGMLTMTSTPAVLGLQWVNQSYNALFNYSHRSQAGTDTSQVFKAYALATGTSCALALGLSRIAGHIRPPWLISTLAVMAAGSANVAFTRANETSQGIDVTNSKGEVLGKSQIAGKYAVGYTILSRSIVLPIPIMVLPGLMSQYISNTWFRNGIGRRTKLLVDVSCILASQAIALPVCIAAFPQTLKFKRSELEPSFNIDGNSDEIVYVQKGV
jgi:tricarboxylate carrier